MADASASKVASRHLSQKKEAGVRGPTANRLVDLAALFIGFKAFYQTSSLDPSGLQEDGELPLEDVSEANRHLQTGMRLIRRFQPDLVGALRIFVAPTLERAEFKGLLPAYRRAVRGTVSAEQALIQASFLEKLLPRLRTRQTIFRDVFKGRANRPALVISGAASEDSLATLRTLATVTPVSGLRLGRKWLEMAATIADVAPLPVESLIADAAEATQLGKELRVVEAAIAASDPGDEQSVGLQEKKAEIIASIEEIADDSVDPTVVTAAAVAEAAVNNFEHATNTGREVGLTPDQESAMLVRGRSIIAAGAGSGKTRVLAAKVVYTIRELGVKPHQIIATSFSRKSAAELKERIQKYGGEGVIDDKGAEDGFGTTHSVARGVLRRFNPRLARGKVIEKGDHTKLVSMAMKQVQMRPQFRTQDPSADDSLFPTVGSDTAPVGDGASPGDVATSTERSELDRAVEAALDAYRYQEDKYGAANWRTMAMRVLESVRGRDPSSLSANERAAVNKALGHPVGGGKGRQMVLRTLERNGVGGFKVAWGRPRGPSRGYGGGGSNYWKNPANQWFNLGQKIVDDKGRAMGTRRVATAISKYKSSLMTPGAAWARDKDLFAAIYGAYEWLKTNQPEYVGRMDFDDQLIQASATLIGNPNALATVQSQYTHIFVDEAQDLNPAQHLLFGLIAGYYDPATQQPNTDQSMTADTYTFIGDDKQAIYEFRGANPDVFIGLSDLVEDGEGFETKLLTMNFRSGKEIVDAANRLIAHNTRQIPMVCDANVDRKGLGVIQSVSVPTHDDGAALAATEIEEMVSGEEADFSPKDFGIACRTNAEAMAFGVELLQRGIPFRSKMNFFNDSTTKAIVAWLDLAANPNNPKVVNASVLEAHRSPRFWLDAQFNEALKKKARGNYLQWLVDGGWGQVYAGRNDWRNAKHVYPYTLALQRIANLGTAGKTPTEILEAVLELRGSEGPQGSMTFIESLIDRIKKDAEAMDTLAEESIDGNISDEAIRVAALTPIRPLLGLLRAYGDVSEAMSYVGKLRRANERKGKRDDPNAEDYDEPAVVIDTVHGWKGLECKRLYVNMPAGTFPHASSTSEEELASERRLAYVALTRGEDSVTVLTPDVNHLGKEAGASVFVREACIRDISDLVEEEQEQETRRTAHQQGTPLPDNVLLAFLAEDMGEEVEAAWAALAEESSNGW